MKIAILAGLSSVHTVRWANAFAEKGDEVHIITSHPNTLEKLSDKITVHSLPFPAPAGYFINAPFLRTLLRKIRPDVLNAHFASGYGTLGRLSRFKPYVLSVWGNDVYEFPRRSPIHKTLVTNNLLAADIVCSTSKVMAQQIRSICPLISTIPITPFGVDTTFFAPTPDSRNPNYFTIGTVKTLKPKYGIDTLLKAFYYTMERLNHLDPGTAKSLRMMIVGTGPQERELKDLSEKLGIANHCYWIGKVPHDNVPKYLNQFDIFAALSRSDSESFGVAVIEASACCLPVVVSNVGGLPEVVIEGETGIVVPKEKPREAGTALIELIRDRDKLKEMGRKGREHVQQNYEWDHCVNILGDVLKSCIGGHRKQ